MPQFTARVLVSKVMRSYRAYLSFIILFIMGQLFLQQAALAQDVVLPKPPQPFTGVANRTLMGSKADWPKPIRAVKDAPNVLLILVDDAGFGNPSTFGGAVNTDAFDQLAKNGLRYNRFHVTALCSPTRAALLSGRNQHAVGFGSISEFSGGWPGYNAHWPKSAASVATILRDNGYSTAAFGKWHLTPPDEMGPLGPFDHWPSGLGFEYFWGFLGGETDQYCPVICENNKVIGTPKEDNFYLNTALADRTIDWMTQHQSVCPDRPFFVYFATGASHAPHQVPPQWSAKYKGKFDQGWDKYRQSVFARQKELGIIPQDAKLTARDPIFPAWDRIPADEQKLYARQMEVYAGFQENTDHEIGRVIQTVQNLGIADNTVIIYIWGDNGASMEGTETGSFNEMTMQNGIPLTSQQQLSLINRYGGLDAWGSDKMEPHYAAAWAWAGNTPFLWGKQVASHLGGTRDGMVISWPKGIADKGTIRSQFTHIIDVAPTILEMAKIETPNQVEGVKQMPMHGTSFAYTFADAKAAERHKQQYFEVLGNRAMYKDGWWLACRMPRTPWKLDPHTLEEFAPGKWNPDSDPAELYNLDQDFSQSNNLAEQNPEKVAELKNLFWQEAINYNVLPLLGGMSSYFGSQFAPPARSANKFRYFAGTENVPPLSAPPIYNRSYSISADCEIPAGGAEGVIVAEADYLGGYALFVQDHKAHFSYSLMGVLASTLSTPDELPTGKLKLRYEFVADQPGKRATGGTGSLYVNGKKVAENTLKHTVPVLFTSYAGFDIGKDNGLPVNVSYQNKLPFAFTGKINAVDFDITPLNTQDLSAVSKK